MARPIQFHYNPDLVQRLAQKLDAAPPKQVRSGLQIIVELLPQIEALLEKGYSLADVHDMFEVEGVDCSFETFRRHVRKAQKVRDRQRATQSVLMATSTVAATADEAAKTIADRTASQSQPQSQSQSQSQSHLTYPDAQLLKDNQWPQPEQQEPTASAVSVVSAAPAAPSASSTADANVSKRTTNRKATKQPAQSQPIAAPQHQNSGSIVGDPAVSPIEAQPPPASKAVGGQSQDSSSLKFGVHVDQSQYFNKY